MKNYSFLYKDYSIKMINFTQLNKAQHAQILQARNDARTGIYMYSNTISEKAHKAFVEHLKKDKNTYYAAFFWDENFLGVGSLTNINLKHKRSYLGIYKNPNFSTPFFSLGSVILHGIEKLAFSELKLHFLHLEVVSFNSKAIDFYKKNGYEKEGILKEFIKIEENYFDVEIYGKKSPFGF